MAAKQLNVRTAGAAVEVDVAGSGPTVALVPGGASTTQGYWLSLGDDLARDATVVTFDRPGTGRSPVTGSLHLPDQAAHLATILEAAGGTPTWLVAHSFGGPVSLQLAVDRPDLVAGLVLLDPTPANAPELVGPASLIFGPIAWAERTRLPGGKLLLKGMRSLIQSTSEKQRKKMGVPRPEGFDAFVDTAFSHQQAEQLLRILKHFAADGKALTERLRTERPTIPGVLVTAGRKPGHKGTRAHTELAELAGLELLVWDDSSHGVHLDQPDRTRELILQHVGIRPA